MKYSSSAMLNSRGESALPWSNFVPVAFTNLHGTKGQPLPKVSVEGVERGEHALRSFRSQEAWSTRITCTDGRVKHQVLCFDLAPTSVATG